LHILWTSHRAGRGEIQRNINPEGKTVNEKPHIAEGKSKEKILRIHNH